MRRPGTNGFRGERALAEILEAYIAEDLQPWTKTFPYEFYEEIFRLRGWDSPEGNGRPPVIGRWTNDIVYERLAPGVLEELRQKNPTLPNGRRKTVHHRWFTPDHGHPKLVAHLAAVMALMRVSSTWGKFMLKLDRAFPKLNKTIPLPFEDEPDGRQVPGQRRRRRRPASKDSAGRSISGKRQRSVRQQGSKRNYR